MPDRSLWPEGVEVHQVDLVRETSARIAAHRGRTIDTSETGVVVGLSVSVNLGSSSLVDVAAGYGYAANGDLVTVGVAQTSLSLADTVAGHLNYVVLFATEVQSLPEAHEDQGITLNTAATASFRVVVMTPTVFNALPATSADLSQNAKDRALIVAQVTATGGALSSGNIINASTWATILGLAKQPVNITGVFIIGISSNTPAGVGTLTFTTATPPQLQWTAPGDTIGAAVAVAADGTYTLRSGNTAYTMTVTVTFIGLPSVNTSDSLTITSLYSQTVAGFSSRDEHHRHLVGSGVPTPTNPHGLTFGDLGGSANFTVKDHQANMHANGIEPVSDAGFLAASIVATNPQSLSIVTTTAAGGINVSGQVLNSTSANPLPTSPYVLTFNDVSDVMQGLYEVYVAPSGAVSKNKRMLFPSGSTLQTFFKLADISDDVPIGTKVLAYNVASHTLQYDGGPVITLNLQLNSQVAKLFSSDRKSFIRIWYNGSSLPGSSFNDNMTAFATVAAGSVFAMVPFSGATTGFLGFGTPAAYFDRRVYGNLDKKHVTGRGVDDLVNRVRSLEYPTQAVLDGFDSTIAAALSVTTSAGRLLRDGSELYVVGATLVLPDNTSSYVYVDETGILANVTVAGIGGIFGANTKAFRVAKVVTSGGTIIQIVDYRRLVSDRVTNLQNIAVGSSGDIWGSLEAAQLLSTSKWVYDTAGNLVAILVADQTISKATGALNILGGTSSTLDTGGTLIIGGTTAASVQVGRVGIPLSVPGGLNAGVGNILTSGQFQGNLLGNVTGNLTGNVDTTLIDHAGAIAIGPTNATSISIGRSGVPPVVPRTPAALGSVFGQVARQNRCMAYGRYRVFKTGGAGGTFTATGDSFGIDNTNLVMSVDLTIPFISGYNLTANRSIIVTQTAFSDAFSGGFNSSFFSFQTYTAVATGFNIAVFCHNPGLGSGTPFNGCSQGGLPAKLNFSGPFSVTLEFDVAVFADQTG